MLSYSALLRIGPARGRNLLLGELYVVSATQVHSKPGHVGLQQEPWRLRVTWVGGQPSLLEANLAICGWPLLAANPASAPSLPPPCDRELTC